MYFKKIVYVNDLVFVTKCKMAMLGNTSRRIKRFNPTAESVRKHNIRKSIEKLFYLLLLNFLPGDFHLVFTYRRGTVQTVEEAKHKFTLFLKRYKTYCKRNGYKFDYIYNTEIGKKGAIHHHCILHNHGDGFQLSQMWKEGSIQQQSYLWPNYDWYGLAEYIVDKTKGGTLPDTHIKGERNYVPSLGLKRPIVKYERVYADYWRKPVATKDYDLIQDSIRSGLHEITGSKYIKYTMKRRI